MSKVKVGDEVQVRNDPKYHGILKSVENGMGFVEPSAGAQFSKPVADLEPKK